MTLFFSGDIKSKDSNDNDDVGDSDNNDQEDELGIVRNNEDLILRENGYAEHAFNLLISKRLGLHRQIKDTRHKL